MQPEIIITWEKRKSKEIYPVPGGVGSPWAGIPPHSLIILLIAGLNGNGCGYCGGHPCPKGLNPGFLDAPVKYDKILRL